MEQLRNVSTEAAGNRDEADASDDPSETPSKMTDVTAKKRDDSSGAALESSRTLREAQAGKADARPRYERNYPGHPPYTIRSAVSRDVPVPKPPFWGSKVIENIALDSVFEYINERALIRGQWQIKRGKRSAGEYRAILDSDIYPVFKHLKLNVKRDRIFEPRVVYGYFPCAADANELVIYRPKNVDGSTLYSTWDLDIITKDTVDEWERFQFPRQRQGKYLCISDFFRPIESGELDICAFQIVTIGEEASARTRALFEEDKYQDYLYLHGLSVETAEALAEYWHKTVRTELGIAGADAQNIDRLFSQGYQGSRYSFGYPACPNLEDHEQLFRLLMPKRIGIALTEEYQLVPEQSTSAIIVHHPEAKYFNVH
jgi:5-methyltetrahydrofolate--homocysteine methyltransferase